MKNGCDLDRISSNPVDDPIRGDDEIANVRHRQLGDYAAHKREQGELFDARENSLTHELRVVRGVARDEVSNRLEIAAACGAHRMVVTGRDVS